MSRFIFWIKLFLNHFCSDNADTHADVNALKITRDAETNSILYAGCGDNKVYSFSLEDGRLIRSYLGHTDYVHNIDIK